MPQLRKWAEKEKEEEYIVLKERSESIAEDKKGMNNDLLRDYFKCQNPSCIYKNLDSTKNTERNKIELALIKSALIDLKNKIQNMSEYEKYIEQPDK